MKNSLQQPVKAFTTLKLYLSIKLGTVLGEFLPIVALRAQRIVKSYSYYYKDEETETMHCV